MTLSSPKNKVCWFVFQDDKLLLKENNGLCDEAELALITPYILRSFKLGTFGTIEYYAAEIHKETFIPTTIDLVPLRKALQLFNHEEYGIVVKAYSIINWDKNHQFCSRCGSTTVHRSKSFERECTSCELKFFPRISPSIIVLIKKNDHLLMARGPHFSPGIYGLIAGFVEVGESIEEAVHREVREEVGLKIKNLSYFGSQAWPFPDSLMIAFTADYESGEIVIDKNEIENANWYKYDNLPGRPSMSVSIASKLIDNFINFFENK
ncbi:MAG: NAD(+) diphosphatase [Proteobacteria bacterium]|nr:NAD(+) diphosphatase [Pseudomonadota bacterium]